MAANQPLARGGPVNTYCKYEPMDYVWDRRKGRSNLKRHGIAFEDAIRVANGLEVR